MLQKSTANNKRFLGSMPEVHSSARPVVSRHQREIALKDVVKKFTAARIQFVMIAGGALGIIRNGTLPEADDDIDFFVAKEHYPAARSALQNLKTSNGQITPSSVVNTTEDFDTTDWFSIQTEGWGPVDVWRIDAPKQIGVYPDMLCVPHYRTVISKSMFYPPKFVHANIGVTVPVPREAERYCAYYYGPQWRVPQLEKSKIFKSGGIPKEHATFERACNLGHSGVRSLDWVFG